MVDSLDAEIQSYEGGTDRWENRWIVASEAQATEMLERIRGALRSRNQWSPLDSGSSDRSRGEWGFNDEAGAGWKAEVSIELAPGPADKFQLTLRVSRMRSGVG